MLGKLIKNEFVQRGRQCAFILLGVLLISGVIGLVDLAFKYIPEGSLFRIFIGILNVIYVFAMIAGVIGIIIFIIGDFRNRLFKDQGYLTHTLPVKTSSIMFSRIVFDVTAIIAVGLVYPLAISLACRDLTFYTSILNVIEDIFNYTGNDFNRGTFILVTLFSLILFLLSCLSSIWMFNAAYAIGHSFTNHKRILSVVAYFAINTILSFIIAIFGVIVESLPADNALIMWFNGLATDNLDSLLIVLVIMNIFTLITLVAYTAITTGVCKKKLNLE